MELNFPSEVAKNLAHQIVLTAVLDDERKVAALQNLAGGLYTADEARMIASWHITSTPFKLFFLSKSHSITFDSDRSTQNHAFFHVTPANLEAADFPDEDKRLQQAIQFGKAEKATIVRAGFYFQEGEDFLQVMWIDPMLMKISLQQYVKDIDRNLYQTDRLESVKWVRTPRIVKPFSF